MNALITNLAARETEPWNPKIHSSLPAEPSPWCWPAAAARAWRSLTDLRAKPAVYFGGKFRIVDFALSNCLNSGIRRIGVLTQYKSHSLLRHLQRGWTFLRSEFNEFIDLLPAQQRVDEESWYRGTADAVYQNLDILRATTRSTSWCWPATTSTRWTTPADAADHVGDGRALHGRPASRCRASEATALRRDGRRRAAAAIVDFVEKPAEPPAMPGKPDRALASMGIYVFDADYLYEALRAGHRRTRRRTTTSARTSFPRWWRQGQRDGASVRACRCVPQHPGTTPSYWRDVGTVDAYWQANLDLATDPLPELDMYDARLADLDLPGAAAAGQVRA